MVFGFYSTFTPASRAFAAIFSGIFSSQIRISKSERFPKVNANTLLNLLESTIMITFLAFFMTDFFSSHSKKFDTVKPLSNVNPDAAIKAISILIKSSIDMEEGPDDDKLLWFN